MPSQYDFQINEIPGSPAPTRLAVSELRRCLMRMTGKNVRLRHVEAFPFGEQGNIFVGSRDQFSKILGEEECPPNELDDEILVTQRKGNTIITGSNPRSVLFATYGLLGRLGARWVGPGYLGEVLPESDCSGIFEVEASEKASYRHRGICIEGAPSLEHALGVIDWMAKCKMNTFFLQFKTSMYFWKNYYSREYNPSYGQAEDIDEKRSLELDQEVIDAAKLRGLVVHRVGHGWTAESLGFPGLGWWEADREPDEKTRGLLALVGGKREFFGNVPINTELCYSNPRAFGGIVEEIVAYARDHPEVDAVHFWLSDATNNFCECDECTKISPSDWYARMIKSVKRRMTEVGLGTRLVFLCYTNTLSPPRTEGFSGEEDGLIYMFAPISRCYSHALTDPSCSGIGRAGGWPLNKVRAPRTNAEFVKIRESWGKVFTGDSFIFDYYFWMPYLRQLNPLGFARLIGSDVKNLCDVNINGMISCQALRSFYPTGLPMVIMAESLWNRENDTEQTIQTHLKACFGSSSGVLAEYLRSMDSILSSTDAEPHQGSLQSGDTDRAAELEKTTEEYSSRLEELEPGNNTERRYLDLIKHYNRLLNMRGRLVLLESEGKKKEAKELADKTGVFLRETEDLTHRYLDLSLLLRSMKL